MATHKARPSLGNMSNLLLLVPRTMLVTVTVVAHNYQSLVY